MCTVVMRVPPLWIIHDLYWGRQDLGYGSKHFISATTGLLEGCTPMTQLPLSHSITTTTLIDSQRVSFMLHHAYNNLSVVNGNQSENNVSFQDQTSAEDGLRPWHVSRKQWLLHSCTWFIWVEEQKRTVRTVYEWKNSPLLQSHINDIRNWSLTSHLLLHESKTCFVRFCRHPVSEYDCDLYHLDGSPIQAKNTNKDLGVIFCSNLSWFKHTEYITSKAYRILFLIQRTFSITSPTLTKKKLYQSLVLPILTYCSPVWRPFLLQDITALEKVQRRATKYIVNDSSLNYKDRLMKLNMLPLMYLLEIADIMFAVSSVKSPGVHFDIHNYITFSSSNTRSSSQFKLNHRLTNNNLTRHSYFYRLPRLWNSLPSINSSLSMRTIKSLITSHLFTHFTLTFDSDYPCSFHYLCPCNSCSKTPTVSSLKC